MNGNAKAKLVTICGIDGSGKTTLAENLQESCRKKGLKTFLVHPLSIQEEQKHVLQELRNADFPSIKQKEKVLGDFLSFCFLRNVLTNVQEAMENYDVVICDRYLPSHLVAQACFGNNMRHLKPCFALLPIPDLSILVDVSVDTALERIGARKNIMMHENREYLGNARLHYLKQAKLSKLTVVDGASPPDEILKRALEQLGI
ncbi:MAG: dTMP kinase [Chlamydiales bacterium]|jgi:dTMP kinase